MVQGILIGVVFCATNLVPQEEHPWRQEKEAVTVAIDGIELTRFHGEIESSLGRFGDAVPKIDRAIVLTYTVIGSNKTAAPRLKLANGEMLDLRLHGNTLRQGILQIKGEAASSETWFELDRDLKLADIFPCQIVIEASPENGEMMKFVFEDVSP